MEFELGEDDLRRLREWLEKTPHLIQDYDDHFLAGIFRAKKGSLNKTKRCIENINALRLNYSDLLVPYDPLYFRLREAFEVWLTFPLPKKTPEGFTVIFICLHPNGGDPSKSYMQELARHLLFICYIQLWENELGSGRWKLAIDLKGFSLAHVRNMTPLTVMRMMKIVGSNIPLRLHSSNCFNVPKVTEKFLNLFKLAASKKIADRIFFYETADKLTETIPRKMLPKEYGGSEEGVLTLFEKWKAKMATYRERFLREEQKMRELDPLRPRMHREEDTVGSFRRLTVD